MKKITHKIQQQKWEEEHKNVSTLKMMDQKAPSGSVEKFYDFLKNKKLKNLFGLELCCGKGRNVIYLAQKKEIKKMYGFDFSENAIKTARERAAKIKTIADKINFKVADATVTWPYKSSNFNFIVDCTGITDVETEKLRTKMVNEVFRVLKPGGYLLVYAMSEEDEYHKELIKISPGHDKYSLIRPQTGKYEKVFTNDELDLIYKKFNLIKEERVEKYSEFFGKKYYSKMHWRIYQKPITKK